ncbi:beta-phosphoglucomutase family hydrolase [Agarilytica rhodophyticola]|uniref:beta-phosphoglucomutase family hydrolase n=1 Tax=Agarilytica rhodophyticola TaxID=1737490 RepID=UPI000B34333F|nr:beta-phosphoglucomutase family hydrolase [Agarilytica rhodophyticola]
MYNQYAALIFDMDGTLIESGKLHEHAWTHALSEFDIPVDRPLMQSLAGVPTLQTIEIVIEKFGINVDYPLEHILQAKERWVAKNNIDYVKATKLADIVREYHGKKPMAVGTGANAEEAEQMLEACGIRSYFECVITSDHVKEFKPSPETFLLCASKLNVEPTQCIVFEDSPLGIEAAVRAGMAAVNVQTELDIINDYFR